MIWKECSDIAIFRENLERVFTDLEKSRSTAMLSAWSVCKTLWIIIFCEYSLLLFVLLLLLFFACFYAIKWNGVQFGFLFGPLVYDTELWIHWKRIFPAIIVGLSPFGRFFATQMWMISWFSIYTQIMLF